MMTETRGLACYRMPLQILDELMFFLIDIASLCRHRSMSNVFPSIELGSLWLYTNRSAYAS